MSTHAQDPIREPYDPIPDIIGRAEKRPAGLDELKDIARIAFGWHQPKLTWCTDGVSKDPATGEDLWKVATVCTCGYGEFPCTDRRRLTAVFGVEEEQR